MIRIILFFLLVVAIYSFLGVFFRSPKDRSGGASRRSPGAFGEEMVRDPECGMHIPKSRAIVKRQKGRELYFCSTECAERHERQQRS